MADRIIQGTLQISRPQSAETDDNPIIRIRGRGEKNRIVLVIDATAEDFIMALTGRNGLPCTIEIRDPE